jgi:nicotinate-nucleotide pyrophosphorylase (carboxylating)
MKAIPCSDNLADLIEKMVNIALDEDINRSESGKDITAELIPPEQEVTAQLIAREAGVLAGKAWFDACFFSLNKDIKLDWHYSDGDSFDANVVLCNFSGNARAILTAERSAMNFLQTLSATATATAKYVRLLEDTGCQLLDTRKTIPGLRQAQKYAVTCGGGSNHRMGLFDAFLIKENHIRACGGISQAVEQAKTNASGLPVEVEVESLDELQQAIDAGADIVMLDNFSNTLKCEAVALNAGRVKLEASGDISLDTIKAVADTGVDYISVGAITKHIRAIDLSLQVIG